MKDDVPTIGSLADKPVRKPHSTDGFMRWVGASALATVTLAAASLIVLLVVAIWRAVL